MTTRPGVGSVSKSKRPLIHCPSCETLSAARTALGYLGDDDTLSSIAGISCRAGGYLTIDPNTAPIPEGATHLGGRAAAEWSRAALRAGGSTPRRCGP